MNALFFIFLSLLMRVNASDNQVSKYYTADQVKKYTKVEQAIKNLDNKKFDELLNKQTYLLSSDITIDSYLDDKKRELSGLYIGGIWLNMLALTGGYSSLGYTVHSISPCLFELCDGIAPLKGIAGAVLATFLLSWSIRQTYKAKDNLKQLKLMRQKFKTWQDLYYKKE